MPLTGSKRTEDAHPSTFGQHLWGLSPADENQCKEHFSMTTAATASPAAISGGKKVAPRVLGPAKRANKSASLQQELHPALKLGYAPMCEVHCNGLQGYFLGGHDRDLYIQCTSPEYADLPLVDASLGGCVMSCSHFERAAGRELSKKWKESIHVVGEGEGSKATLLAWLKRQAETIAPDVVGAPVWVCWCNEAEYRRGTIVSFNRDSGKHKVCFHQQVPSRGLVFNRTSMRCCVVVVDLVRACACVHSTCTGF